jgi:hypothetical protein
MPLSLSTGVGRGSVRALGDAVTNVVDRIVAGHLLLLQEIGKWTFLAVLRLILD